MVKKILPFLCSLAPLYAFGAENVVIPANPDDIILGANEYAIINSGSGVNVVGAVDVDGFVMVLNNATITPPVSAGGDLYITNTAGNTDGIFGITSGGNVSVGGDVSIEISRGLQLNSGGAITIDGNIGGIGSVDNGNDTNAGEFAVTNATSFLSGAIVSGDLLSISAGQVTTGNISSVNGITSVIATNALQVGDVAISGTSGNTTLKGATITAGNIQNSVGEMGITASGNNIDVNGSVQNFGTSLTINALSGTGTLTIDDWLTNSGNLTVNAKSVVVNGDETSTNTSFVNSGVAVFNVSGLTSFANGINLSGMVNNGTTELDSLTIETGTLSLGTGSLISNDNAAVNITVTSGVLGNVIEHNTSVSNGNPDNSQSHNGAQMVLSGLGVDLASVYNNGKTLTIGTESSTANDDINIYDGVTAFGGTITDISAGDTLNIGDNVSNSGNMTLHGDAGVVLSGVSNSGTGATLNINTPTNTGSVIASGAISNIGGTTTIVSKGISLSGITNNGGTLTITGSDNGTSPTGPVTTGFVMVNGGIINVNALAGNMATGAINVQNNGVLNIGSSVNNLTANGSIVVAGNVNLADAVSSATGSTGDVYLTTTSGINVKSTTGISVTGNIVATGNTGRSATFDATTIGVNNVNVAGANKVTFGTNSSATELNITNTLSVTNGGSVEIYSGANDISVGTVAETGDSTISVHGQSLIVNGGNIGVSGGVHLDGTTTGNGLLIDTAGASAFVLKNTTADTDITVGSGIFVSDGNTLNLVSARNVTISGDSELNGVVKINTGSGIASANNVTFNDDITTSNNFAVTADTINIQNITNTGTVMLTSGNGTVSSGTNTYVSNSGDFSVVATGNIDLVDFNSSDGIVTINSTGGDVTIDDLAVSGGTASITGTVMDFGTLTLTGGKTTVYSSDVNITGATLITGNMVQGGTVDNTLHLVGTSTFDATSLNISSGGFTATSGSTTYTIINAVDLGTFVSIANGSETNVISTTNSITAGDVSNYGILTLNGNSGVNLGVITNGNGTNAANLTINPNNNLLNGTKFINNTNAVATLSGTGMNLSSEAVIAGKLYQGYTGTLSSGDVSILNNNYNITTSSLTVNGIKQSAGAMVINTSNISVIGDIDVTDLKLVADTATSWSTISVNGDILGNTKIIGLKHMTVTGNYRYDDNSMLHVAVLPYGGSNYWADISLVDDDTFGQITNRDNNPENALVYVGGHFVDNISGAGAELDGDALVAPEIGIDLYSVVDQGSAIWLLYANNGLDDLATKIRNLNVNFCNADGSVCFNYLDAYSANNGSGEELPIYLSVRDYDNDGTNDSLYIVFDPRFGGPVKVFDIAPIVSLADNRTNGEISGADALDKMVSGQLQESGFYNDTPIEVIPVVFADTNLSDLATELYNRMERYVVDHDGTAFANLSRLIQPREIEQFASSVALNEHTSFRDIEDHMFNEFIWNRNRNLNRVWFDADFGMLRQNGSDNKTLLGNRLNLSAGFDFQASSKSILGLTAHISRTSSHNSDNIDLGYMPGVSIAGHNSMDVSDTNIGFGVYLLHTLGLKTRVYGNAFVDAHLFDVSREQNYVADVSGFGTAFSLISEWGLMHDWLNQYVVGNLYARFGYNTGFSIREEANGDDYMRIKSDGYAIFTPGYSLTAQKRIYTSPWFQVRPYMSIGVEYDVLEMPDVARYKFGPSKSYTKYDIETDPLWANIGGGFEMLSANGVQFGLDYRYQYNNYLQLHNIRLSGSYRF